MVDLATLPLRVKQAKDWSGAGGNVDLPSLRRVVSAARVLQTPSINSDVVQVQPRSKPDGDHEHCHKRQINLQAIRRSHVYQYATLSEDPGEFSISHHQCFALSAFSASAIKFLIL